MHKPNHNEEDFFDLIARPEGVVPKNFEAAPQDNTGTNNDLVLPEPRLNLGESLASPRQFSVSNAPMSDEAIADMAMGMVTPFAGTVRGLREGARLVKATTSGSGFDIYKNVGLLKDAKKMPKLPTFGTHKNVFESGKKKLVEAVKPAGTDTYGNNVTKHSYQIKSIGDYTGIPQNSLSRLKFNLTAKTTPGGQPYKELNNIDLSTPTGSQRDSGRLLSNILSRADGDWAVAENNMSLDALNTITQSFLKKASKVEFYQPKGYDYLPLLTSNQMGKYSEFAQRINAAKEQNINPSVIIKEIADELTYRFMKSGKVQGANRLELGKLFRPQTIVDSAGKDVSFIEHTPFYLKSFKERLAGVMGLSLVDLDKYIEKDLSE